MATTNLLPLRPDMEGACAFVAGNLREWDRKEVFATQRSDDPGDLAAQITRLSGMKWLAVAGGVPIACIGAAEMWPGVWSPWCFGTDKFPQVALLLTRVAKRAIIPTVRALGGRRLEVKTMEGHIDSQRWMERAFGASFEARHPSFGKGGETFLTFSLIL
jgi:hypothetical protein